MAIEHETTHTIYQEKQSEKLISPKTGTHTIGSARFLKPLAKITQIQSVKHPKSPLLHQVFANTDQHWPESAKIQFKGCRYPQKKWQDWVEKLSVRYGSVWEKAGICDAIMTSVYEIRLNKHLVLGLAEFWCVETNTFTFPWGEASITLDDLYLLAGLPVVGEYSVTRPLAGGDSLKTLEKLEKARSLIRKSRERKASFSGWMNHFFGDLSVDHELEHVAFLALWLSRYVFTSLPDDTIASNVFPVAIRLARGASVALAPAVLAAIYQDLRLLTEKAKRSKVVDSIVIAGPFQLVQLWAFERFPLLAPDSSNSLRPGEPRVARWAKLNSKITLPLARSVLKLPGNFEWRPFAVDVKNWRHSSFYKEDEVQYRTLSIDSDEDDGLLSFLKCVRPCELVGLDGTEEKYMPHRVAMQFGFDQDVPGPFSLVSCKMVSFFVPARTYQPGVTARYLSWWKESKRDREDFLTPNMKSSDVKPSPRVDDSFLKRKDDKVGAGSNDSRIQHPQVSRKHDVDYDQHRASAAPEVAFKPTIRIRCYNNDEKHPRVSIKHDVDCEQRASAAPKVAFEPTIRIRFYNNDEKHPRVSIKNDVDYEQRASAAPKVTFKPTIRSYNDDEDHISLATKLQKAVGFSNTKTVVKPHDAVKINVSADKKRKFSATEDLDKHFDDSTTDKGVSDKCDKKPDGYSEDVPAEIYCSSKDDNIIKKDQTSRRFDEAAEGKKTVKVTKYIRKEYEDFLTPNIKISNVKPSPRVDDSFLNRKDDKVGAGSNVSLKQHPQVSRKHDVDYGQRASAAPKVAFKPTFRSCNNDEDTDDEDHISLATRLQKAAGFSSTKTVPKPHGAVKINISADKKRKFSATTEDPDKHFDSRDKGVSDKCDRKPGGYSEDVPAEIYCSSDDDNIIRNDQSSRRFGEAADGKKTVKVTKYIRKEYVKTVRGTSGEKLADNDLEGRVKKLEKLMGVRS